MVNDHHLRIGKQKLDPLTDSAEAGRVLFERLMAECRQGFPLDAIINAATNVLLNVIRQRNDTRDKAEADFNEMFGRTKAVLMQHYDGPSGRRRSIFPFHQVIYPPFISRKNPEER